ncbi:C-C motif chemokine 13-like [Tyto alba]|uniref:C-C motif chemokine 13 n=1 Tax=Tyto alba TaxID=56313 RepID=UPI0014027A4B|nr:C-C motif chemokine 13 [Tyto alba]XP_042647514.1 C-C motif chemokine 13-like [Tyto alba]XP_042660966.1 C-C motif chemokine 13-like [Tyto alba]XP_042660970.1 C-C motif chemokine 13-like [Tyto alba]
MKVFSLTLLTLLLAALWTRSQGMSFRSHYGTCCYKEMFIQKKIPAFLIKSFQETPSHCSHKAVRVEMLKGKKFCVDPQKEWFQQYRQQQESTSTST